MVNCKFCNGASNWNGVTHLSIHPSMCFHLCLKGLARVKDLGRGCYNRRFQNPGIARKGGLTHARIFLVNLTFNIHSVQNSYKIDKIDALFVAKSTSVPGLGGGGGGLSQSWQCQDFGSSRYGNPSLRPPLRTHLKSVQLLSNVDYLIYLR